MKPRGSGQLTHTYKGLRRTVGIIGILLPAVVAVGYMIYMQDFIFKSAVSQYYHTVMGDVFVAAMCVTAFFMFYYVGYDRCDNWTGNVAGFFALGVAFFRTDPTCCQTTVGWVHNISAVLFFATLIYFSGFRFTKSKKGEPPTARKKLRNKIYIGCAIIMAACLLAMILYVWLTPCCIAHTKTVVFWLEATALGFFGVSWFIKGETLFKDKKDKSLEGGNQG